LEKRLKKSVHLLGELELADEMQVAIIEALLSGEMTVAELSERILGSDYEYHAGYMRIRRALEPLESKGIVSRAVLGKPKPYRLTIYGKEKLSSLATGESLPSLITYWDIALYVATLSMATASALGVSEGSWLPVAWIYLAGMSTVRLVHSLRRVI